MSGIGTGVVQLQSASPASSSSPTPPAAADVPATGAGRVRHVWVSDPPGIASGRFPGLLVEWRRDAAGWAGYVAFAVPEGPDVVTVRAWVPAAHLRPA